MKKTLTIMAMTAVLLLTQCKKPSVELPTPATPEGNTVSMTVMAGPGSKTDITADGGITWSTGDKLYVGDGTKYIGCLEIQSGVGNATGMFSGIITADAGNYTFNFFYLGNANDYTTGEGALERGTSTSVAVDFSNQTGVLGDLGRCHVGHGTATGKIQDGTVVFDDGQQPVTMTSKVAIAYFGFETGATPYTGALTLSGANIYNSMTVGFNGTFSGKEKGSISLTNTTNAQKYVMLVPTGTDAETLNFGGGATGTAILYNGVEANKFYRMSDGSAIQVKVTASAPKFSVSDTTTVEFSPGNLYWDGSAFHFEANQWDYSVGDFYEDEEEIVYNWDPSHVSHFFWSNTTDWQESGKEPYAASYSYSTRTTEDVFFTNATETTANPNFHVNGETGENQWRTLSIEEWEYLFTAATTP